MEQTDSDHHVSGLRTATGRRGAVSALGVLGMGLLATLGATEGTSAKKKRAKKKRGATGSTAIPGPAGPAGTQGPAGPPGSAPAVSVVRGAVENFSVATGGANDRISLCPGSSRAISRRINIGNPLCGIVTDTITVDGGGWGFALKCPTGQSSGFNVVEVICLA